MLLGGRKLQCSAHAHMWQCSSEACLTKKHAVQVTAHAAKYHQTHHFHIATHEDFGSRSLNTLCCLCVCTQRNQLNNALTKAYDLLFGPLLTPLSSSFLHPFFSCQCKKTACSPFVLCSTPCALQRIVAHAFFRDFLVSFSAGFSWSGSWSGVSMMYQLLQLLSTKLQTLLLSSSSTSNLSSASPFCLLDPDGSPPDPDGSSSSTQALHPRFLSSQHTHIQISTLVLECLLSGPASPPAEASLACLSSHTHTAPHVLLEECLPRTVLHSRPARFGASPFWN